MSKWPATKAKRVLAALLRNGWRVERQAGSHKLLKREGWQDYEFAFHDNDEIGRAMLSRIAKHNRAQADGLIGIRPSEMPAYQRPLLRRALQLQWANRRKWQVDSRLGQSLAACAIYRERKSFITAHEAKTGNADRGPSLRKA